LTLQHTLTYGDDVVPAVTWALSVRGAVGPDDLRGGSPLQLGGSIGLSKEVETFRFYLRGRFAWFGRQNFFGLKLRTTEWSATAGVEWNFLTDVSIIGQYVLTSGGVDGLQDLSRPSHEVVAGFKWEIGTRVVIDLAIVENVINFQNSPDFGIHGGITI